MPTNESHYLKKEVQAKLYDVYLQYHKSIKIFITQLESLQNRFPVEIVNEIRAVFSHIAKVYVTQDISSVDDNIRKAQGHMRRAQLDAFKYMCYAYLKYYNDFKVTYRNVDLSKVNNGEFLIELTNMYTDAVEKTMTAKEIENTADDTTESYSAYEEAYYASAQLYKHIKENLKNTERLQEKEVQEKAEYDKQLAEFKQNNQDLLDNIKHLKEDNENLLSTIEQLKQDNEQEKKKSKIVTYISIAFAVFSAVLTVVSIILGVLALR